ncbi:MAG: hypothetical protein GX891_05255 [Clostridiales bacterium]|nr:hypothetical protein [Clostridiales bacterium]
MQKKIAVIEADDEKACAIKELAKENFSGNYTVHIYSYPEEAANLFVEYDVVLFDYTVTPALYEQLLEAINNRTVKLTRNDIEIHGKKINYVFCIKEKKLDLEILKAQWSGKSEHQKELDAKINGWIDNIFSALGIKRNLMGAVYMARAIKIVVADFKIVTNGITKKLYPQLATEFETTESKVERALRHVIDGAYKAGRFGALDALLGGCVFSDNYKPTNGEFIAFIAEKILIKLKGECGADAAIVKNRVKNEDFMR